MENDNAGQLFSKELMAEIRSRFLNITHDPREEVGERLFFDNAGGSFRLKKALEVFSDMDALPDCPERVHNAALYMKEVMAKGVEDMRIIFGAKGGAIITELTASRVIFSITGAIAENIKGTNIVTTVMEHPSAFDACSYYAEKTGKELRVAKSNPVTGGVDIEEIVKLIDKDTCLLSIIYASNISGAILDVKGIVKAARAIKPDLYIIIDSVQHVPHSLVDTDDLEVDGMNFAPYKFFGVRGSGIGYVSDRVAKLPHHKLSAASYDTWWLGSPAPGHYAVISEIVDYVCFVGAYGRTDTAGLTRRELYAEGMKRIKLHERALLYHMLNGSEKVPGLRNMPGVNVYLDYEDLTTRDLLVAVGFDNIEPYEAVREYEKRGVIVFERVLSSIYSKRMLESFGLKGVIRVSPLHCNTVEEIDKFLLITQEMSKL